MPTKALMIAAPSSGNGKTVLTLALLRLLRRDHIPAAGAKVGPDYIDPAFHALASGKPGFNLDTWAMRPGLIDQILEEAGKGSDLLLLEGVMGLFDGGVASSAALAKAYNIPILLLLDVKGQVETAIAILHGLSRHDPDLKIKGIILNRIGSPRHEAMIRKALAADDPPVIAAIPSLPPLRFPDRHLGLVQAREYEDIEILLDKAARAIAPYMDIKAIIGIADYPSSNRITAKENKLNPLFKVNRLSIAHDDAFAFLYPHLLHAWRHAGVEISFFSPLADQGPDEGAEAIFLPGGYPELYAGQLANNRRFCEGMKKAAAAGKIIYGECGGYMVLGEALVDRDNIIHPMLGLLPLVSDFSDPKLHLGYREVVAFPDNLLSDRGDRWRGHEFHYARIKEEKEGERLFQAFDREGRSLGKIGRRRGRIMGSFFHFIDHAS